MLPANRTQQPTLTFIASHQVGLSTSPCQASRRRLRPLADIAFPTQLAAAVSLPIALPPHPVRLAKMLEDLPAFLLVPLDLAIDGHPMNLKHTELGKAKGNLFGRPIDTKLFTNLVPILFGEVGFPAGILASELGLIVGNQRFVVPFPIPISFDFALNGASASAQCMGNLDDGNALNKGSGEDVPFFFGDLPILHGSLQVVVNEKIARWQVTTQLVPQLSCKSTPYINRIELTARGSSERYTDRVAVAQACLVWLSDKRQC